MKAWHVTAQGEQRQVGDLPVPEVTDGTVLVRVKAAGLNAVDNGIARGMMTAYIPHEYPVILGRDAAGVVEAVGAGVDHVRVGDEVFGHTLLAPPVHEGTLAEFALLPGAAVAIKPPGLDFVAAAALPLASTAAATAVDAVEPQAGQVVLVNGATGGVGSYAVQLLKARGERLAGLGADQVVDSTASPVADQVRAAYPDGVDALVNLTGMTAADVPLGAVRAGGKVVTTTAAPDEDTLAAAGVTSSSIMARPVREVTEPLAAQAEAGQLTIDVETVLPFEQAAEGLATIASGNARGKIVVTVGD